MTMTCHATAHPSHSLMLRPGGAAFNGAHGTLGNRFHAGTGLGDTRLCHNWDPWSTRLSSSREP